MRFEEIRQHEHRAIEQPSKDSHNGQETDERWHGILRRGFILYGLPFFAAVVKDAPKA
jgi:hypothetical protein